MSVIVLLCTRLRAPHISLAVAVESYLPCTKVTKKVVKHDGVFLKSGWAELHQTGAECSQTIPSGPVCFRISKHCPTSAERLQTDGPLPKKVEIGCFPPKI